MIETEVLNVLTAALAPVVVLIGVQVSFLLDGKHSIFKVIIVIAQGV